MIAADVGSTSSSQLKAIRDWNNQPAWTEFQQRYDPLLRSCCRALRLDAQNSDEVCQLTWIEVSRRMKTFVYDPTKSFRGWLRTVCTNKALDYAKKQRCDRMHRFDERDELAGPDRVGPTGEVYVDLERDWDDDPVLAVWKQRAEKVQAAVRAKVQPKTWEAFWLLFVWDWSVEDTVKAVGITRLSAYKAKERVLRQLRDEGRRQYASDIENGSF